MSPAVLMDMSTKRQRSTPPSINGGHESRQGRATVLRFISQQRRLGEQLKCQKIEPFPGGATVSRLLAVLQRWKGATHGRRRVRLRLRDALAHAHGDQF